MTEFEKALDEGEMDRAHGFQRERGFAVDEIVGELVVPVVLCHSDEHPAPAQRVVMFTVDGKVRVHDYLAVGRAHGRQIVGDKWTWGKATAARVLTVVGRVMVQLEGRLLSKLAKLLGIH